jgi:hypothetical protein
MNGIKTIIVDDGIESLTIRYHIDILGKWEIISVEDNYVDHQIDESSSWAGVLAMQLRISKYAQSILIHKFGLYSEK